LSGPRSVQEIGYVLSGFTVVEELAGVVDLFGREFHLAAKLHARRFAAFTPARVRSEIRVQLS
jgi:hypothetical protein